MKLADSTAGAVAQRHSGGPAVTAAMDEMAFLTRCTSATSSAPSPRSTGPAAPRWRSACGSRPSRGTTRRTTSLHVASAYFVFVAIDADGPRAPIPGLAPETPDEVRRMREAEIRRAHRLAKQQEILEAGGASRRLTAAHGAS